MQQTFSCPRCGLRYTAGYKFCGNCGTALTKETQPDTKSDIPLGTKTGFSVNNVVLPSDDKLFLLLYTLTPRILRAFGEGESLLEIETEFGLPVGIIRATMDRTKWTVTMNGKTHVMPLKEFTELIRKQGWQIGHEEHSFDENGLLSEKSLIGILDKWITPQSTGGNASSKHSELSYARNLICLRSGNVPLKSRDDKSLMGVDPTGELCILIVPRVAFEKVDFETKSYSEQFSMSTTIVCLGIDTANPALMPASCSFETVTVLNLLARIAVKYYDLPQYMTISIPNLFSNIQFIQLATNVSPGIMLQRTGKTLDKSDFKLYQEKTNKEVKGYHMCLFGDKPRPYTLKELYSLKLKALLKG